MLLFTIALGGLLLMMGHHSRAESGRYRSRGTAVTALL